MKYLVLGILIPAILYAISLTSSGERAVGVLETIQGIPYPKDSTVMRVEENLAHADIYLQEPVFAKELTMTVSFEPGNAQSVDLGVREGSFWLGYAKQPLYTKGIDPLGFQTKELHFPLTTMLQEKDRSLDIMFFANGEDVSWSIHRIRASVTPIVPSLQETKEYIKSIIMRERAL